MKVTEHGISFRPSPRPVESVAAPVSRIAQLLALAIRFEKLLRSGKIRTPTEIACKYGISRSRVSQILNLTNLSPVIREAILLGRTDVPERTIRPVVAEACWTIQSQLRNRSTNPADTNSVPHPV